jgi:uncharacterized protein (DUF58 family)
MKYGSGKVTKFDYARTMAATLAYLILLQRDAASLAIFDTKVESFAPRTDNLASIHNLMGLLAAFEPGQKTNIAAVLNEMALQIKRKGIIILISDFFDDTDEVLQSIQHLRFNGSEVIVFHVLDPYEIEFPFNGVVEFLGLEGQQKLLTRPAELRKSYLAEFNAFAEKLRGGCERNGCNYVQVNTATPWHEVLSSYLATRQHRYR